MGGDGSGRKPDVFNLIKRQEITPLLDAGMQPIEIPNLSGVKPEALRTSSASLGGTETDPIFLSLSGSINTYIPMTLSGSWNTHINDTTDPHGAYITQTNLESSGIISGSKFICTSDFTTSGSERVFNCILGTDATPPTASGFVQGTIYIRYTP